MRRIFVQAKKEWAEFKRDRLSLALAFILPVVTLLLFGYGVRLQARNIPVLVQDRDGSDASRAYTRQLYATNAFAQRSDTSQSSPEEAIRESDTRAAIVIPRGFRRNLDLGRQAEIKAFIDGSDINSAEVLSGVIAGTSAYFANLTGGPDRNSYYVRPELRIWFNPGLKEALFIAPGVFGIILWMYPALLAAVAVSREIEQGTIVQAYASSLTALEFLLGKTLTYVCVGAIQAWLSITIACLLFGLKLKTEPSLLLAGTAIYLIAAVLFGLVAGVYTKHQTVAVQATATGGFFPALLLSGFVYPINNIPMPLSLVCMAVPARYYIELCRDTFSRGRGWAALWYEPVVLAAFALLLLFLAWRGISRMQVLDK